MLAWPQYWLHYNHWLQSFIWIRLEITINIPSHATLWVQQFVDKLFFMFKTWMALVFPSHYVDLWFQKSEPKTVTSDLESSTVGTYSTLALSTYASLFPVWEKHINGLKSDIRFSALWFYKETMSMIMVWHNIDNFCVLFFYNVISHLNAGYNTHVKRVIFTSGSMVSWVFVM